MSQREDTMQRENEMGGEMREKGKDRQELKTSNLDTSADLVHLSPFRLLFLVPKVKSFLQFYALEVSQNPSNVRACRNRCRIVDTFMESFYTTLVQNPKDSFGLMFSLIFRFCNDQLRCF
ncbi:unnamed protein product [Lactuca saligna]|uniref:Uncharacterized protein n=1 Tax=Lactuca saligna TaxID=75948 RepID=A0AA35ZP62_LACSI|nr:unnamed protein product [Lactuca saligna]